MELGQGQETVYHLVRRVRLVRLATLVLTPTRRTSSSHHALHSFFEWLNKGKDKIPHFTKRTGAQEPLMCLAGLWDSVTYKGTSEELHTFTIITTSSNKYLSFLHDRMPVILADRDSIETWLDTSSGQWSDSLAQLLKPFAQDDGLVSYPVPKEVGKVGNQSSDFLKPISQRKGNIMSFFNKPDPRRPAGTDKEGGTGPRIGDRGEDDDIAAPSSSSSSSLPPCKPRSTKRAAVDQLPPDRPPTTQKKPRKDSP